MSLQKYLQQLTKEQLIKQIIELNKKYKDVKTYYEFSINPDGKTKTEQLKEKVSECFYPKRGYKLDLKVARKIVNDFKKLSPGEEFVADLMLHYVECGVAYTNDFGDISGPFYDSIASMFKEACTLISNNDLVNVFDARCQEILKDSADVGWGFHDYLCDLYDSLL